MNTELMMRWTGAKYHQLKTNKRLANVQEMKRATAASASRPAAPGS
jgi:hypothetical protein